MALDKLERICAKCGTANSMTQTRCSNCGTNLVTLPARRDETRLPVLKSPGALAIALGAGALIARAGFRIAARVIAPTAWKFLKRAASRKPAQPLDSSVVDDDDDAEVVIRGWRAWSVRRGNKHSSGEDKFEWKIKKKG